MLLCYGAVHDDGAIREGVAGHHVLPTKGEASHQAWRVGLEVPQPWSRVGGEDPEPGSLVDETAANVGGPGVDGCAHRPTSEQSYRLVGRGPWWPPACSPVLRRRVRQRLPGCSPPRQSTQRRRKATVLM